MRPDRGAGALARRGRRPTTAPGPVGPLGPLRESLTVEGVTYAYPGETGGRRVRARAGRPDAPARRDRLPRRRQRQRQDDAGQAAGGPLPARARARSASTAGRSTPSSIEAYRQLFSVVFADGYLFPTLLGPRRPRPRRPRRRRCSAGSGSAGVVTVEGGRLLDDRPLAGPAEAAGPAGGLPGRPAGLRPRRVGVEPGPALQAGLLPARSCPSCKAAGQDAAGHQPRRGLFRRRRPRRPPPTTGRLVDEPAGRRRTAAADPASSRDPRPRTAP